MSLSMATEAVTGGIFGIDARNFGSGALTIDANGDVEGTGAASTGIFAQNNAASTGPLSITSQGVTGGDFGIRAQNDGTGALEIAANGDVAGTTGAGIDARQNNAAATGPLSITTEGVTGGLYGIFALNNGMGALEIVANGDVGDPDGIVPSNTGIYARNYTAGTNVSITTEAMVTGGTYGIFARNYGTGALEIEANGDVAGNSGSGIFAQNTAAANGNLMVTTGAGTTVTGYFGIDALNYGDGALIVTANGSVTGTGFSGIFAQNHSTSAGTYLTVTAALSASGVTGQQYGVDARNYGSGMLTVIANGDVEGTDGAGILALNDAATAIDITVGAGATIAGGDRGVWIVGGTTNSLKNYGTIENLNGLSGEAIRAGGGDETVDNYGAIYGVTALGGGNNIVNNFGLMIANSPVITGGAGDDIVNNSLIVTGDVDLDGGNNQFNNFATGVFNSGDYAYLGAGNFS